MSDLFSHLEPSPRPAGRGKGEGSSRPAGSDARAEGPLTLPLPASGERSVRLIVDNTKTQRRDVLFFYVQGWAPPDAPLWEWRMKVEPVEAIARVLKTLRRRPEHVVIEKLRLGDLGVISAGPGEPKRPLCMIPDGLELVEAQTALALLTPKTMERRA